MCDLKLKSNIKPICGVYSIVNKINGKEYIGQSIDIERRWKQHRYGKGSLILTNAIKKYGLNNFEFEILETINIENKEKNNIIQELTILEQKWFEIKKPFLPEKGYNIQKTSKPNLTPSKDKNFGEKISKIKIDNNHTGKPLKQYELNGNFIKLWKSAAEVERCLGFKAENISACCLRKTKTSNNFIWRFEFDLITDLDLNKLMKREKPLIKKIRQVDLNGKLIKIWDSLKQLVNESEFDNRGVKNTCNGLRNNYKGYKWEWC